MQEMRIEMDKWASIVLPIYNGGKYLKEFLASLEYQTYRPLQVIIGDDCSSDNSLEICETWKKENEKIDFKIILVKRKKNIGLSQNLSKLIEYVEGNYIFLADQDDVWLEEKVERQVQYFESNPHCVICLCDRAIANERLDIIKKSNYAYLGYTIKTMDFEQVIKHRAAYAANCMAIRNKNINKIFSIPVNVVSHDTFITMMAARYGTIDFLYDVLLLYRIHGKNISGNFQAQFSKNIFQCFLNYLRVEKRAYESAKYDEKIIKNEFKTRFMVDIDDYDNCFKKKRKVTKFIWAIQMTRKAYQKGIIGIWSK
jgi:glycosyltransferase involved in cell wall biosynthesis